MNIDQLYIEPTPYTQFTHWEGLTSLADGKSENFASQAIEIANKILVHYNNSEFRSLGSERAIDLELRSVKEIIERYEELNSVCDSELNSKSVAGTPVAGRCRDLALLICSQFRERGIPARLRFGFTHMYYKTNLALTDHVVVEYFDEEWKILEPRGTRELVDRESLDIDPVNVEKRRFISGSRAWKNVRAKKMRSEWFSGATPNSEAGLWYIRKIMLYDLASLCRFEPDIYDTWGYLNDSKPGVMPKFKPHLKALDELAEIDVYDPSQLVKLVDLLVEDERFLPDGEIQITPMVGKGKSISVNKADYVVHQ